MSPWQLHGNLRRMFTTSSASASASAIITSFLRDLSNERDLDRLVHSFKQASQSDRFRSKHRIYERTVRRLALAKRFQSIEDILEHQKTFKDISKEGFSARLITLYGKSGMVQNAHKVFDEMPQRNCPRTVLSLNALLASYLHSNVFDMVPTLFNQLPTQLSVEPNLVTYNTVIKAFCEMGSFDSASSMLDDMELKGVKPDVITFNTLLDGLYSNDRFEDGEKIWKRMEDEHVAPDVQSYNAKLVGMCVEKRSVFDASDLTNALEASSVFLDFLFFEVVALTLDGVAGLSTTETSLSVTDEADASASLVLSSPIMPFPDFEDSCVMGFVAGVDTDDVLVLDGHSPFICPLGVPLFTF
ncbi:hypothetical protein Ahy_A10g050967 isoform B [Arachis hypogaea]|uniref:Pentatricopeptide repeat-containing protein n=1 Tax=Arachis hypogaea TaxID=3818 RepID=A0A445BB08_ARAHY|nr:hypothetical protein Ahy_A10g050967 isoform B [Arachis hypogaea]